MRRLLSLIFALCFTANCFAQPNLSDRQHQHDSMHWIVMATPTEKGGCTANAIGPHALLTAQHCDLPGGSLTVDGDKVAIVEKEYDGHDHMILIVTGVEFRDKLSYHVATPKQGDYVHMWGNPKGIRDQYREGLYSGSVSFDDEDDSLVKDGTPVDMFMMSIQPGDSGSAILNEDGQIVGVVTYGIFNGMFAGCYSLQFSKDQISRAQHAK